jgi:hypothetical protein
LSKEPIKKKKKVFNISNLDIVPRLGPLGHVLAVNVGAVFGIFPLALLAVA